MALFLPDDFKTCSTVNFLQNPQILEAWKLTKDMKFRPGFFSWPSTYKLNIMFWALNRNKIQKNQLKRILQLHFFELYISWMLILERQYLLDSNSSWHDIRKKKINYLKEIRDPQWWLRITKKKCWRKFLFLNAYQLETQLINIYKTLLILSDHMGVLGNYFCLKMISKLASR